MRATFITTTPRASLEALRYQGIAVSESHAQLQSMLQNNLSPEHALFLAEPVPNNAGDSVDWYTPLEGDIVRLDSLPPEEQEAAAREVRRLAGDIDQLAESLKRSGEGPKSIRGNILALALSYPGPEYIYMAGKQPVLLGWGFSAASAVARPQDLMRLGAAAPLAAAPPPPAGPGAVPPAPPAGSGWLRAILSLLFGLLLCLSLLFLSGLLLGYSGCPAAGLPRTNGTLGCAPAPPAPDPKKTAGPTPEEISALTAEQEKERSLRRQIDDLRAQLGDKLAACPRPKKEDPKPEPPAQEPPPLQAEAPPPPEEPAEPPLLGDIMPTTPEPPAEPVRPPKPEKPAAPVRPPKPEKPAAPPKPAKPAEPPKPAKPAEPPKPPKRNKVASGDTLEIPDDARKNNDLSFLEGCWYCETGLVNAVTGEPITVLYCFDDKGGGSRTIQEKRTGRTCRGGVTAQFDSSGKLRMRGGPAQCSPGRPFVPQTVECQQQGKKAECFGKEEVRRSNRWRATFRRK